MEELLQRYIKGDCTQDESLQVLDWIEENDMHLKEYQALRKLYDISVWNTDLNTQKNPKVRVITFKTVLRETLKVAAALVFGAIATINMMKEDDPEVLMQKVCVPAGQRAELHLSDGTKVWLNAGSTLSFPNMFSNNTRMVTLEGEGYFDVMKAEDAKFIVQTKNFDISVLGTEFNVKAYNQDNVFQVDLLEGAVEVSSDRLVRAINLEPNQSVNYNEGNLTIIRIRNFEQFRWKEGLISFEQETIDALFKKIELYYDVKIHTENEELLTHSYFGKFWVRDGVEHILKVLQLEHRFKYEFKSENKEIKIIKIDCL